MHFGNTKQCLAFILALIMAISMMPFQTLAAGVEVSDQEQEDSLVIVADSEVAENTAVEESETVQQIQKQIDDIIIRYLGNTKLTEEEVSVIVSGMDWDTVQTARWEIYELENSEEIADLSETEKQQLVETNVLLSQFADVLEAKADSDSEISLYTTVSVLDGKVSIADSANSNTVSNGTVTIQAKGSLFGKKTNNITITNTSANKANLSFDYSVSMANSFKIAGENAETSGTRSVTLDKGYSLEITLVSNSGLSNTTATLTLSNIILEAIADSANITIEFDSNYGSVTGDGETIISGKPSAVSGEKGIQLVASPKSGAAFLGWINSEDGKIKSKELTYQLSPSEDETIEAVFVGAESTPWFSVGTASQKSKSSGLLGMSKINYYEVGKSYLFDDLNAAASAAAADSMKYVVLSNSGTLAAGDYTIPSGVTLLIPFDAANTLYTTQACSTGTYTKPTAYRTLTLADGANLIINGEMSLSANHRYAQGSKTDGGSPTGAVSFVKMEGNSNITINNGGALYAYGFITGTGSVTAESGSTIYENFQFMDFRGGTQSTDMENGVFPLSQYYVQNIEVPITYKAGAKEYAYTTVYMSSADFGTAIAFIGNSNCMFNLTSGYAVKRYDGGTDRLIIELYGDMSISQVKMEFGTSSINSKDYDLPINGNITINAYSGDITISQDIALLPGAKIHLNEGVNCTLNSGFNLYVYDADTWGKYCGAGNLKFIPLNYAPGRTYTRTEADLADAKIIVNGTIDASAGYIYTTAGGANICSGGGGVVKAQAGTQAVTHQLVQGTGYTEIPLTPAKLKNEDGSYTEVDRPVSDTYKYKDGVWSRLFDIYASNIAVQEGLDLYFYVKKADLQENVDYYAKVTKEYAPGYEYAVAEPKLILDDDWEVYDDELVRFCFNDISAKEMTDNITAVVYYDDGNNIYTDDFAASTSKSETIEAYALRTLEEADEKTPGTKTELKTALADLLFYGLVCQNHFAYNIENLVDWETYEKYATSNSTIKPENEIDASGTNFVAASVSAKNKLVYTFYFDIAKEKGETLTATVSYADKNEVNISESDFYIHPEKNWYGVDVELPILYGRAGINCSVYSNSNSNQPVASGADSVLAYAARMRNDQEPVFDRMIRFVDSANIYFDTLTSN